MKSITRIIFFLPLSLSLLLQPLLIFAQSGNTNTTENDLLAKVCDQTEDKDFCLSSLKSDPESQKADLSGLAMIALNVASETASETWDYIESMRDNASLGPTVQQGLEDCLDEYLDASEQLEDSIAALLANAYQDIRLWVHAAIADVVTCENGFKKSPGKESVLTQRNNNFRKLCKIVLVINKLLAHK